MGPLKVEAMLKCGVDIVLVLMMTKKSACLSCLLFQGRFDTGFWCIDSDSKSPPTPTPTTESAQKKNKIQTSRRSLVPEEEGRGKGGIISRWF